MNLELNELLLKRLELDEEAARQLDAGIWHKYGKLRAVLISDMSGFSWITAKYGILHFLSLIVKNYVISIPLLEKYKGQILKSEADNLYAAFDDPIQALRASLAIQNALSEYNRGLSPAQRIKVCHGIAYGQLLDLGHDMYGHPMNVASKLSEDIADSYETLITPEVYDACKNHPEFELLEFEQKMLSISNIEISYYRLLHRGS